jgi:hypothetical protein
MLPPSRLQLWNDGPDTNVCCECRELPEDGLN